MATLNDGVKAFIVQALACFDTPSEVSAAVKEEFGLDVGRQQVSAYDPYKAQGKSLSKKWRDYFDSERKKFKEERESVAIANRSYRLRRLQKIVEGAKGNHFLVMKALEQAAKDEGGMYTNTRIEKVPQHEDAPKPDYTLPLKPDEDVPSDPIL